MSKLMRNALLLVAIQGSATVAAAPVGINAMLCRALTPRPVVAESAERNNIKPYLGHSGSVVTSVHSECEFEIEFATSGALGVAPKWAPLLRACGFAQTITPGVNVIFSPITNNQEAVTIDIYIDGIRHRMTCAKGSYSTEIKSKSVSVLKFKFTGLHVATQDAPMPVGIDYSAFIDPLAVNYANTPTWALHGHTGALDTISFDVANQVVYRNLIGEQSVQLTDRKPTGNVSMEMVSIAEKDWFDTVIKGTLGTLTITHGTVAGNIIEITAPKVQLSDPSYSEADGVQMIGMKTIYMPNIGNDELIITLR